MFFIQYLGVGFYAHIIISALIIGILLIGKTYGISVNDFILLFFVLLIFFIKLINIQIVTNILLFKFYWGFILFYFFFKISRYSLDYNSFYLLVCFITVVEFVLINTIIPIGMLRNVPGGYSNISASQKIGLYYRCYGLGSSPTVSATILVVLLSAIYVYKTSFFKDRYIIFAIPPLIMLGSGTGFFLFIIFLFKRYELFRKKRMIICFFAFFLVFSLFFIIGNSLNETLLMKFSLIYVDFLINFKMQQIADLMNKLNGGFFQLLFGYSYETSKGLRIMSDFGWVDMLEAYGCLSVCFIFFYLIIKKKLCILPVFIFVIGAFHYPGVFSIPGQILFGSLLAVSPVHLQIKSSDEKH